MSNIWNSGDFAKIAPAVMIVGELLCDAVPTYAGQRVLDLGCGSGNTALAAARRRAQVFGLDPIPTLLQRARERAAFEGLEIEFTEGSAEVLPYEAGSFDVVLSSFGMIFCEDWKAAVAEVARVLRPNGHFAFTSWTEGSLNDLLFAKCIAQRPDLQSVSVARDWGKLASIPAMLRSHFGSVRVTHRKLLARAASVEQWLDGMKKFLSPVYLAYEGLNGAAAAQLDAKLIALGQQHNQAPEHGFFAPVPYLEIHCRPLAA
ncbi:class I SAM-dependent methyltransferase [Bryobacter aggregatus]|uniref:class I SAM-dependent methyltransferase n=1 Tax=Bryobacter aggregatus TaxID=360054 RepID=UPI00068DB259|nr:class I SAM-dependent methyltransferase [Bryobacter aggregatus]